MKKSKKKNTNWLKTRKFFNDIHLWAGLISGILLILICFSGTIYTYNTELTEWASPHLHHVNVPENTPKMNAEQLASLLEKQENGTVNSIKIYDNPSRSYNFFIQKEGQSGRQGTTFYVNPYTGDVLGNSTEAAKTKTSVFMKDMFSLHRWLLLDRIEKPLIGDLPNRTLGSYISGTATILFTIGVISGLVIWFPRNLRRWKDGLSVKWSGSWKRINHDLHNSFAFYASIFLLIMGLTGPQWSFPWYRTGLQKTLGTYTAPTAPKQEILPETVNLNNENLIKLPLTDLIRVADQHLSYTGDYTISWTPEKDVSIRKNKIGFFAPAASDEIKLNAYTANVEQVSIFSERPVNERIAGSIKALHIGNVYGQFTKILYFISCLIATSLPITGTIIWINKFKKSGYKKK